MPRIPDKPYLGDQRLDILARQNTELLSELWILRDRVMVLEKLLEERNLVNRAEIDAFAPDAAFEAEITAERDAMVERVIGGAFKRDYTVEDIRRKGHR